MEFFIKGILGYFDIGDDYLGLFENELQDGKLVRKIYKSLLQQQNKMHLHKKHPQYQLEQQQQQLQNKQQYQQIQPNQAEVDGQRIKLSGLDYSLLQKQKQRERRQKSSWMTKISQRVKTLQLQSQSQPSSLSQSSNPSLALTANKIPQNYKSLESYLKNSTASAFTSAGGPTPKFQSYFQFNLTQFDRPLPSLIMKRIGKAADRSVFVQFQEGFFREWRDIAAREKEREDGKKVEGKGENGNQMIAEDSQDDIFGNDSDQNENNAPIKKQKKQLNIQIGKKLDFGLSEQIFAQKRPTPTPTPTSSQPTAQDKYFFMPKPKKMTPSIQAQLDDGYDQCYHQSGPSLQQLVSLKKQGIQYYGDLKEREKKERKGPNVHKEYEMVKKIMERNQKNGK